MKKKSPSGRTRSSRADAAEYRFKIDAYTPETMPMARLAQYLEHLAQILGEPNAVHFLRLEKGSTAVVSMIEPEAYPKVRERTASVRRGDGPSDAIRAYRQINRLLISDNGIGVLEEKRAGIVLHFPGRDAAQERFPSVRQHGSVDGQLMRVGGTDETVPVLLRSEEQQISGCWTDRHIAKQLAQHLFEHVRLYGHGKWCRDPAGVWSLLEFKISSFEVLQDASLTAALAKVRAVGGAWTDGAYDELKIIRHGAQRRRSGGD